MSLLELQGVHKHSRDNPERLVLREVCMQIEAGQLAAVWGLRRSGRSTLLRLAAGLEAPDAGVVRFEGQDLATHGERLIGGGIGYCQKLLQFSEARTALEDAMVGMLASWVPARQARARAREALARVEASHCEGMRPRELSGAEAVRVALARTLTLNPRLLVIDEPVYGVELCDRDEILALLRRLANEGIAVLASTGESTGLSEADLAFALGGGELHGAPAAPLAPVLPLRRVQEPRESA